jgi:DNA-binding NarL/FixJ family response regulator
VLTHRHQRIIRVLIADDQALVRAGFRVLLASDPEMDFVGEAADGQEAVQQSRALRPDVVLMDIRMPRLDGLEATRIIANERELVTTRVLILTTFEIDEYVFDAIRAGASGFLHKDCEPTELLRGVRVVASGEALLAPSITRKLIAAFAAQPRRAQAPPAALAELTDRERQMMVLVAAGRSNDEIADDLVITTATAKTHVSRARPSSARDRAQLVVLAYETGLVSPRQ